MGWSTHVSQSEYSLNSLETKNFIKMQSFYPHDKATAAVLLNRGVKWSRRNYFKYWVAKHFKLLQISSRNVLYCQMTINPVIPKEELLDTTLIIKILFFFL